MSSEGVEDVGGFEFLYLPELQGMSQSYPVVQIDSTSHETWTYEHIVKESPHNITQLHSLWFSADVETLTYENLNLGKINQESNVTMSDGGEYRVNKVEPGGKIVSLLHRWCDEPLSWKSYQLKQFSPENKESTIFFINHFSDGWKDIVLLMRGYHSLTILHEYTDEGMFMRDVKITTVIYVNLKNPLSSSILAPVGSMTIFAAKQLLKKSIGEELGQVFSLLPKIENDT